MRKREQKRGFLRARNRGRENGRARALALATAWLLVGCATSDPTYDPALQSPTVVEDFREVEAGTDLAEIGALVILFPASKYFQATHRLDGAHLATQTDGYLFLPLHPGEHVLDTRVKGRSPHSRALRIRAGEALYLKPGDRFDSPFVETTREHFVALLDRLDLTDVRVPSQSPVERFLPAGLRQLIEGCSEATAATLCARALAEIPPQLVTNARRKTIADRVAAAAEPAVAVAAPSAPSPERRPAPAAAPERSPEPAPAASAPAAVADAVPRRALILAPELERDRLMLAVGDLFAAERAAEALPYFEQLDALPVPLDPAFDFYRAQAHLAVGDRDAARQLLTRFLARVDRDSAYYQPALRLMTRLEAGR